MGVFFIYFYTGRPGHPDPDGWDAIPGAHGSTPQALAYNELHAKFQKSGITICGNSNLDLEWQLEFSARPGLHYALLSDHKHRLTTALPLDRFEAGGLRFLRRRMLVCNNGVIVHDRTNIDHPQDDAANVLGWMSARRP